MFKPKPRREKCDGCKLWFMSNELETVKTKVRVGKKRIITAHLALCVKCRQIEILESV